MEVCSFLQKSSSTEIRHFPKTAEWKISKCQDLKLGFCNYTEKENETSKHQCGMQDYKIPFSCYEKNTTFIDLVQYMYF